MKKEVLVYMFNQIGNRFLNDTKRFIELNEKSDFVSNNNYNLLFLDDRKLFKEFFESRDIKSILFYDEKRQYIFKKISNINKIDKVVNTKIEVVEKDFYMYNNLINYNFIKEILAKYNLMFKIFRLNLDGVRVSFFELFQFLVWISDENFLNENFDSLNDTVLFKHISNLFYKEYEKKFDKLK